jgi:hypothetical protein
MENQKPDARQKSLSWIDMSSAFLALGFGLSLAFTVFLVELISGQLQNNKKRNNDRPAVTSQRQPLAIKAAPADATTRIKIIGNKSINVKTTVDSMNQRPLALTSDSIQEVKNLNAKTLVPSSANEKPELSAVINAAAKYVFDDNNDANDLITATAVPVSLQEEKLQ